MEIQLNNVGKKIHKTDILENITFTMHSGNIYGLWGENGSGKTTILRLLAGLIYPTSGTVAVDGKYLGRDIDFPESIGLLLETPAFLDDCTGKRNLQLIAALKRKADDQMIDESLRFVALRPNDRRKYRQYSLGMKQRLGIAAAIMEKPDLILLDEPTNALDEDAQDMLKDLIWNQKERGALLVVTSHDRSFLSNVANEIFQIKDGHLRKGKVLVC